MIPPMMEGLLLAVAGVAGLIFLRVRGSRPSQSKLDIEL
jgi:hypothetical protein